MRTDIESDPSQRRETCDLMVLDKTMTCDLILIAKTMTCDIESVEKGVTRGETLSRPDRDRLPQIISSRSRGKGTLNRRSMSIAHRHTEHREKRRFIKI